MPKHLNSPDDSKPGRRPFTVPPLVTGFAHIPLDPTSAGSGETGAQGVSDDKLALLGKAAPMPPQLRAQVDKMIAWAKANEKEVRQDRLLYWGLKIPVIAAAAASALLIFLHLPMVSAVLSAIAAACAIVEGLLPRGALLNAHTNAVHDLSALANTIDREWGRRVLEKRATDAEAAKLLKTLGRESDRIAANLKAAETSLERSTSRKHHSGK